VTKFTAQTVKLHRWTNAHVVVIYIPWYSRLPAEETSRRPLMLSTRNSRRNSFQLSRDFSRKYRQESLDATLSECMPPP